MLPPPLIIRKMMLLSICIAIAPALLLTGILIGDGACTAFGCFNTGIMIAAIVWISTGKKKYKANKYLVYLMRVSYAFCVGAEFYFFSSLFIWKFGMPINIIALMNSYQPPLYILILTVVLPILGYISLKLEEI